MDTRPRPRDTSSGPDAPPAARVSVRVWDLPTRVFHWALVFGVVSAVIAAHKGGDAMVWHARLGLAIGALVVFRLLWGVVGGRWSRFSSFLAGPASVRRYLQGQSSMGAVASTVGHNPLGGWSVMAMLLLLLAQVITGTVSDDEIGFTGPLISMVSEATSQWATRLHKTVGQFGLYLLVALHVVAILFYRIRRGQDLVTPMVNGDKLLEAPVPASADGWPQRWLALVLSVACATAAVWVSQRGG